MDRVEGRRGRGFRARVERRKRWVAGALASLARFLSDSGGAGASTTLSVVREGGHGPARACEAKKWGVKISLYGLCRAALSGMGSAAAVSWVGDAAAARGCVLVSFAHTQRRSFCNRL